MLPVTKWAQGIHSKSLECTVPQTCKCVLQREPLYIIHVIITRVTGDPEDHGDLVWSNLQDAYGPNGKFDQTTPQAQLVYNWVITCVMRAYNNELLTTFHLLY